MKLYKVWVNICSYLYGSDVIAYKELEYENKNKTIRIKSGHSRSIIKKEDLGNIFENQYNKVSSGSYNFEFWMYEISNDPEKLVKKFKLSSILEAEG